MLPMIDDRPENPNAALAALATDTPPDPATLEQRLRDAIDALPRFENSDDYWQHRHLLTEAANAVGSSASAIADLKERDADYEAMRAAYAEAGATGHLTLAFAVRAIKDLAAADAWEADPSPRPPSRLLDIELRRIADGLLAVDEKERPGFALLLRRAADALAPDEEVERCRRMIAARDENHCAIGQHLIAAHKPGEVDEEAVAILDGYHVGARKVAGASAGEPGETTLQAAVRLLKLAKERGAFVAAEHVVTPASVQQVTVATTPLQQRLSRMADRLSEVCASMGQYDDQEVADLRLAAAGVEKWAEVAETWRAEQRQRTVADWTVRTFGPEMMTPHERVLRVLEEALELAQAENLPAAETTRLADYVYSRPAGDPAQEVGGLRLTILAYCATKGLLADDCEAKEIARVLAKPAQHFRDRNVEKAHAGVGDYKPAT